MKSAKIYIPDDAWIISPNKDMCGNVAYKDKNAYIACTHCEKTFSQINRKHHCKGCGEVMCGDCARVYKFAGGNGPSVVKFRCCIECKQRVEAQHNPSRNRRKSKISNSNFPAQSHSEKVLELVDDDGYDSDLTCTAVNERFSVSSTSPIPLSAMNPMMEDCSSPTSDYDLQSTCLDKENVCNSPLMVSTTQRPNSKVMFKSQARSCSVDHPLVGSSPKAPPRKHGSNKKDIKPLTLVSPVRMFGSQSGNVPPDSAKSDKSTSSSVDSDDTRKSMGFLCFINPSVFQLFRPNKPKFR